MNKLSVLLRNIMITGGLNVRKPVVLYKILKGYFNSYARKSYSLRFMDIALTYSCNFKCDHCSATALINENIRQLTCEDYRKFVEQENNAGVIVFHFTGGEPLLHPDLFEIIKIFKPKEHLISIQTNGWLIDDEFLMKYKDCGGDIVCVSVDSSIPDIHDAFRRQPGSWKRATDALKKAHAYGFRTVMASTVKHGSFETDDFKNLICLSKQIGAILALNLAVPAGRWRQNLNDLLDADDRKSLNSIIRQYPHVRTDFESNWRVRGCPAFKEKCYLTPSGEVMPCPFIHVSFGNVTRTPLAEIQKRACSHEYLKKYHPICLAAEDRYFIEHAGCYNFNGKILPISSRESQLFRED